MAPEYMQTVGSSVTGPQPVVAFTTPFGQNVTRYEIWAETGDRKNKNIVKKCKKNRSGIFILEKEQECEKNRIDILEKEQSFCNFCVYIWSWK